MLNTCFYFLVNMSISSSVVIVMLLLVRRVKVIPKRWLYPLWSIALFRMMIPVALSSSISIFNGFRDLLEKRMQVRTVVFLDVDVADSKMRHSVNDQTSEHDGNVVISFMNSGGFARVADDDLAGDAGYRSVVDILEYHYPIQYKTPGLSRIFRMGMFIWIAGVFILLSAVCISYSALLRQFRDSRQLRDNIYMSTNASSPFLLGILRPKIILPEDFDTGLPQMLHITGHEQVHIKRRDNLWRLSGLVVTCLHWFNPFVWLGYSCFLKDMEFSCDEMAIKDYDPGRRKEYAEALLATAGGAQRANPIPAAFGKTSTRTRIVSVLTYRQLSWLGTACSVLFVLIMAIMLVTNAQL